MKKACLTILAVITILCSFLFAGCDIFGGNSNNGEVTLNGIRYQKINITCDGISVEAYSVVGCNEDITVLNIPDKVNDLSVLSIRQKAFANNLNLREVTIPNSIKSFPLCSAPFSGCTNIEKITAASSDIMLLFTDYGGGDNNKANTVPSSLHYIYLSSGCTKIGTRDFYYCSNIREIHIPLTVTEIEDGTNLISVGVNGHEGNNDRFANLPFVGCSSNLTIYCAAPSKPEGWKPYWNYVDSENQARVLWNNY